MAINLIKKAQFKFQSRVKIEALLFDKISVDILAKYSNYNIIFLAK